MAGMMGVVLAFGMGFGALRSPTYLGVQAVTFSAVAAMIVATAGAIACRPKAFWAGFAIVGWASLLLGSDILGLRTLAGVTPSWFFTSTRLPQSTQEWMYRNPYRKPLLCRHRPDALAIAQGLIGGLIGLAFTRRWIAGKSVVDRVGTRMTAVLCATLIAFLDLAAMRFPETIWGPITIQAVCVVLFGAMLRCLIPWPPSVPLIAFLALAWGLLPIEVRPWTEPEVHRSIARIGSRWLYTTLYPQVLNEWWNAGATGRPMPAGMTGRPMPAATGWRSILLGEPPGAILPTTSRSIAWIGGTRVLLPWRESEHFQSFACAAEHLACLVISSIVALIVFAIVPKKRRDGPIPPSHDRAHPGPDPVGARGGDALQGQGEESPREDVEGD